MEVFTWFFAVMYILSIIVIGLYCLAQFYLWLQYMFHKRSKKSTPLRLPDFEWHEVTIQLPLFNEKFVAERLLENIMNLEYPKEKITIQILDDSRDETLEITQNLALFYKNLGFNVSWIHREDRKGFKAGALAAGMKTIQTPFIAIFDADFLPEKDFLIKTIPHFSDRKVGVVQTRWTHLNQHQNMLTELQAIQLNVHFTIEQSGRYLAGHCLQFNGTAGVWRKETILDAGGWQADTLTEDLDLSYRAQLKGWKIKYLEDVPAPAELPSDLSGLKSQQFRWMKGGAENAKKLLPAIWSSHKSWADKLNATAHLLSSSVFLAVLSLSISSIPLMILLPHASLNLDFLQYFLFSFVSIFFIYITAHVFASSDSGSMLTRFFRFCIWFPVFLSLSMAMAWHNSVAVWQGWRGQKSPFIRTPKSGFQGDKKSYFKSYWSGIQNMELLLAVLFFSSIFIGISINSKQFIYLHSMLFFGYSTLVFYALKDVAKK